jgi:hypothetical protein
MIQDYPETEEFQGIDAGVVAAADQQLAGKRPALLAVK